MNIRLEASCLARHVGRLWASSALPGTVAEAEAEKMLKDILRRAKKEWEAEKKRRKK